MIDFALVVVIIALLGKIAWSDYQDRKERAKLINAIVAKTPEQFRDIEFVDKVQPPKMEPQQSDLISTSQLTDQEFMEHIEGR